MKILVLDNYDSFVYNLVYILKDLGNDVDVFRNDKIALEEDIPAYLIFTDATLKEMERERPMCEDDFKTISGVGQRKLEVYGEEFMKEIVAFMGDKIKKPKKADTYKVTLEMYQQGLNIDEIAEQRDLSPTTIFSHLAKLYTEGEAINVHQFVSTDEVTLVRKAKEALNSPETLKPYFEFFEEKMEYFKIRLALSVIEKEG